MLHNIDEVNAARVGLDKRKQERKEEKREKRLDGNGNVKCAGRKFGLLRDSDS